VSIYIICIIKHDIVVVQLLKVEETCRKSDEMAKELEERIKNKLEQKAENRNSQIESMVQRLREHVSYNQSSIVNFKSSINFDSRILSNSSTIIHTCNRWRTSHIEHRFKFREDLFSQENGHLKSSSIFAFIFYKKILSDFDGLSLSYFI
jgi:chromosome condensin MukBEF ATPase and DNA-binding subunit MukB